MTRQYLVGELLLLLIRLQAEAGAQGCCREVALLRTEVQALPPQLLGPATARAVDLANAVCWASLQCGDIQAFTRQSEVCADLYTFGVCSGLLPEDADY